MDLSVPRGIDDVDPGRYAQQDRVRTAFEGAARTYNFQLMEPASLEHLGVLRAKSGEGIDQEIYSFKDKAGRDLGLRFDMTVGITRYVCSRKDLKMPAKLAASGGIWRYDEPQYARYRWSHQWDLEIFGQPSVESDAEVIDAGAAILRGLKLADSTIKVGDRRVVEEYIRGKLRITDEARVTDLMRALDKVEKKSGAQLKKEYVAKGFGGEQVDQLLDLGRIRGKPDEVLSEISRLHLESAGELTDLADKLDARGVSHVEYNLSVVRGIDYYTGIVFEAVDNRNPRLGSLFGGGRYDALPKIFGRPDLSATGAAGGIERLAMSLGPGGAGPGNLVYVASPSPTAEKEALRAGGALRREGIPCELPLQQKPLSKQLEDASRLGAAWVVIIGEREVKSNRVTLRDMATRKEESLSLSDAIVRIRGAGPAPA